METTTRRKATNSICVQLNSLRNSLSMTSSHLASKLMLSSESAEMLNTLYCTRNEQLNEEIILSIYRFADQLVLDRYVSSFTRHLATILKNDCNRELECRYEAKSKECAKLVN